jgi:hypothetical protein
MLLYSGMPPFLGLATVPIAFGIVFAELDPLFAILQSQYITNLIPLNFKASLSYSLVKGLRFTGLAIGLTEYGQLLITSNFIVMVLPSMLKLCLDITFEIWNELLILPNNLTPRDCISTVRKLDQASILCSISSRAIGVLATSAISVGAVFLIMASFVQIRVGDQLPLILHNFILPNFSLSIVFLVLLSIKLSSGVGNVSRNILSELRNRCRGYAKRNYLSKVVSSRRPIAYSIQWFGHSSFFRIELSLQFDYFYRVVDLLVTALIAYPI